MGELVLAAIGLVSFAAFNEGDFAAAELHVQAMARAASHRLEQFGFMSFITMAIADLRMACIYRRPPLLPYYQHPHMGSLVNSAQDYSKVFTTLNALSVPRGSTFGVTEGAGPAFVVLQNLYQLALVHDSPTEDYTSAGPLIYRGAYTLALLQVKIGLSGSWTENLAFTACQMQFWGICKPFVAQTGIQKILFQSFAARAASTLPEELCSLWIADSGGLDFLLWALCNAFISVVYHEETRSERKPTATTAKIPDWLLRQLRYVVNRIKLVSFEDFDALLKHYPFVAHWNGSMYRAIFDCLQTESLGPLGDITVEAASMFANMRLIFD